MAASVASSNASECGVAQPSSASSAVNKQLKTLCLREFPCGLGSWREPKPNTFKAPKGKRGKIIPLKKVTKKDTDTLDPTVLVQTVKSEALQELVSSHLSPWHLDYSWSQEAKELREVAVKSPWLIDQNFVLNFFKTLRIVDKNVAEIDEDILMLKNLEELTASANFITSVNSKNLPPSLKVLELCANQIRDISSLCVRPPPLLTHLGLGYNRISFIGDYITGDYWPNLLSLDLSHNDLCELVEVVRKLITLPNLRNLILQGCPLCLIPSYRGFTIDSLRRLSIMDDVHISADEKHHFKGLARRLEFIVDEARVQLGVTYIKGLPCPDEIKHPENYAEFPVIERRYFVQFMFPEDEAFCEPAEEGADPMTLEMEMEAAASTVEHHEEHAERPTTLTSETALMTDRRVEINSKPEVKNMAHPKSGSTKKSFPRSNPNPESECDGMDLDEIEESVADEAEAEVTQCQEKEEVQLEPPPIKLTPINSDPQPWAEEIEFNWTLDLTRDDLLTLRNFFRTGMDFNVVESLVLGYPPTEAQAEAPHLEKQKPKEVPKGKGSANQKDKKKNKKDQEIELVKSPPTYKTIATFHVTLENFLEGEFDYQNTFTKGDIPSPSTVHTPEPDEKKDPVAVDAEKKDSKKKIDKGADKKKDKNENARKSPRVESKEGKKVLKGKEESEEVEGPPPPLEMEVTVKLHHWTTAMDSVREEEARAKALLENKESGSKEQLSHSREHIPSTRKGSIRNR